MWSAISNTGSWAAFLGLCLWGLLAYHRGKIISPAEYTRTLAEHERALEVERRIAGYHERRAEVEAARADKADAALAKLVSELPPALNALSRSNSGSH